MNVLRLGRALSLALTVPVTLGFTTRAGTLAKRGMTMNAEGSKVYLITGSTDGIGKHTAKRLAALPGAIVLVHGRNPERVEKTVSELRAVNPNAEGFVADLGSFASIRQLAEEISSKYDRIDALINNAGVFEQRRKVSAEGLEMTFAVNVAAPYLLTSLLLPLLQKKSGSRIINVSSISQGGPLDWDDLQLEKGYSDHNAYSLSKLLMAMYSTELAKRFGGEHLSIISCDPGTVNTKMLRLGWGSCGTDVSRADDEFYLATDPAFAKANGKYFVGRRESRCCRQVYEEHERERLWELLDQLTGAKY